MNKIQKALIIRLSEEDISMEYSQMCAETCERYGIDYEFVEGIYSKNYVPDGQHKKRIVDSFEQPFKDVGSFIRGNYRNTIGNICCHATAIKCWKRIIDLDIPCIILEHDSLIVGSGIKNLELQDMAIVTFGHRVKNHDDYSPIHENCSLVKVSKSIGGHAYGMTPKTAKFLYEDAVNNGIYVGSDRLLFMERKSGLPLYVCDPPQAVCWVRESTNIENRRDLVNYEEALTDSWYEGLKERL